MYWPPPVFSLTSLASRSLSAVSVTVSARPSRLLASPAARAVWPHVASAAPLLSTLLVATVALLRTGVPAQACLAYGAYVAVGVVVPGTLLHRWVAGYGESLLVDVAWGAVLGLMLELLAWAAATAAGVNRFLWIWPLAVVLAFAVARPLRPLWRRPVDAPRTPPLLAWAAAVACALGMLSLAAGFYRQNLMPPSGRFYFVDVPWHLAVSFESTRSVPLQIPEAAAEGTLPYHWFADAHFGASSLISGVALPTVVLRTGMFALVAFAILSTAALAIRASGRASVAAVSVLLVSASTAGAEYWTRMYKLRVLDPESPTSLYSVGVFCLLTATLVDLVRSGRLPWRQWLLLASLSLMAIGAKPSVLAVLIPSVGLVLVVRLVRRRRTERPLVWALAIMTAAVAVSLPLFASPNGSVLQPTLREVEVWRGRTGVQTPILGLLMTALVKGYLPFLTAVAAAGTRRVRSSRSGLLLLSITLVGFVEAWAISHPGLSQRYFWTTALPAAEVVSAWGLILVLDRLPKRRYAAGYALMAAAVSLISVVAVRDQTGLRSGVLPGWLALSVALVVIAALGHCWKVPIHGRVVMAALSMIAVTVPASLLLAGREQQPSGVNALELARSQAARWVLAHVPQEDELATNSHCLGPIGPYCDARSFWLAGFGGHRVLLEGYGVTPSALRLSDVDGRQAWHQPYHDQHLYRLNEQAFYDPSPAVLQLLSSRYRVRWLVADTAAGRVSPLLPSLTRQVYSRSGVQVYQLQGAAPSPPARSVGTEGTP